MYRFITIILLVLVFSKIQGQQKLLLWPNDNVPNQNKSDEKEKVSETNIIRISNVQYPSIELSLIHI